MIGVNLEDVWDEGCQGSKDKREEMLGRGNQKPPGVVQGSDYEFAGSHGGEGEAESRGGRSRGVLHQNRKNTK